MRRGLIVATACLVFASLVSFQASANAVTPPSCWKVDAKTGLCIVTVGGNPGSGTSGGTSGGTTGGSTGGCQWDTSSGHAPGSVPCSLNGAAWSGSCYLKLEVPQPPQSAAVWQGHTDGAVYVCTAAGPGESGVGVIGLEYWYGSPPAGLGPDPAQLAREALATLTIPGPTPGRYPAGRLEDGRPYTLVGPAYTWYWTDPATFKPLAATASAGGVSSTVTVTPSRLLFTPGDGSAAVSCAGPGVASPAGCQYVYRHSSLGYPDEEVTATYGISWTVAWSSNTGGGGVLPGLTTSTTSRFAVAEAEAVVIK